MMLKNYKGRPMFSRAIGIVVLAIVLNTTVHAQTAGDAATVFAQYLKAINAGDKAALRDLISEGVDRHTYGACTAAMSNRDCLLKYVADTVIDQHARIDATDSFGVIGDKLLAGLVMSSDAIRASGATNIVGIDEIIVRNGRIAGLAFLPNWQHAQTRKYLDYRRSAGMPGSQRTAANAGAADEYAALFAQYVRVVNAGDVAGLRAMIADDVERSDYRACTAAISNKDCLMLYIETTVIRQHGHIEATESFGIDGGTIYGGLILKSDTIRAAGSERAHGIDMIKVRDGKIAGLKFLPNLQDPQTRKFFDRIRATGTPSSQPYVNQ